MGGTPVYPDILIKRGHLKFVSFGTYDDFEVRSPWKNKGKEYVSRGNGGGWYGVYGSVLCTSG